MVKKKKKDKDKILLVTKHASHITNLREYSEDLPLPFLRITVHFPFFICIVTEAIFMLMCTV